MNEKKPVSGLKIFEFSYSDWSLVFCNHALRLPLHHFPGWLKQSQLISERVQKQTFQTERLQVFKRTSPALDTPPPMTIFAGFSVLAILAKTRPKYTATSLTTF